MDEDKTRAEATGPFLTTLNNYKKVVGAVVALGGTPPFLDLVLNIGPPWPHRTGVACFTTIVNWVVLLATYSLWRHRAVKHFHSRIAAFAIAALCMLLVYAGLTSVFVYDAPDARHQEAVGFVRRPDFKEVTVDPAFFADWAYDPLAIWEPWSVGVIRTVLLASWVAMFGCLATMTSAGVLLMEKQAVNRARRRES